MASEDTCALTLKDKCRTREQRGQMITDNREDRRVIGPGGRLKASGRDTGYTDTENGPPAQRRYNDTRKSFTVEWTFKKDIHSLFGRLLYRD